MKNLFAPASLLLTLALLLTSAAKPAEAAILFDFSLPAAGEVDPLRIQFTFDSFSAIEINNEMTFDPIVIDGALTLFEGDSRIVLENSKILFVDFSDFTVISFVLNGTDSNVLSTMWWAEAFGFARNHDELGAFTAWGDLSSDYALGMDAEALGTLVVSEVSEVPEPATLSLVGLSLAGAVVWRKRKHTPQSTEIH